MTDETELEIIRGRDAQALIQHPLLVEAFEAVESEVMHQWKNSPARDEAGREKLWLSLKLLQKVRSQLESVIQTGQVAEVTLAQRLGQRLRSAF